MEETLAAAYAEVLGLDRVGVDDDFFAVGGDSIRSIQVVSRARAHGVDVSPRQIFECPHGRRTRRESPQRRQPGPAGPGGAGRRRHRASCRCRRWATTCWTWAPA
ncbi:phosphopantetheine-binding protein [Streptomyces sp. G45]|uniref:phosphopantetheine-binding protein n=1 Tax=Streptomyces sp. G45 TaxID=3406627 RepID=UPI003C19E3A2